MRSALRALHVRVRNRAAAACRSVEAGYACAMQVDGRRRALRMMMKRIRTPPLRSARADAGSASRAGAMRADARR